MFEDQAKVYKEELKDLEGGMKEFKKQYEAEIKSMQQMVKDADKRVKDQGKVVKNAKKASEKAKGDAALKAAWDAAVAEETRLKNEKMEAEQVVKEAKDNLKNMNDNMGK